MEKAQFDQMGEQVWEKINHDPSFAQMPEAIRMAEKKLVLSMPEALADFLDIPVDVLSFQRAKHTFLKFGLESGILADIIADFTPGAKEPGARRDRTKAKANHDLGQALIAAQDLIETLPRIMASLGVDEATLMVGPQVGFNDEAKSLYLAGELTIGKLLLVQPMVIFKNS